MAVFLSTCSPEKESPAETLTETRPKLLKELATPFESQSIGIDANLEIRFPSGISTTWLASNLVNAQGQPLESDEPITLKVRGFIRPEHFIQNAAHTMGPGGILNSGGQLEFRIEKDGIDLTGEVYFKQPITVRLPADYPLARLQSVPVWEGEKVNLSNLDQAWYWKPGLEISQGNASLLIDNRYFQTFRLRKPGLVLLGQPYLDPSQKVVQLQASVPAGIGAKNALCMAWFPNLNALVRLHTFDSKTRTFNTAGYRVPENATVVFLLIHHDGTLWKFQQNRTFTSNGTVALQSLQTLPLSEITRQLRAL